MRTFLIHLKLRACCHLQKYQRTSEIYSVCCQLSHIFDIFYFTNLTTLAASIPVTFKPLQSWPLIWKIDTLGFSLSNFPLLVQAVYLELQWVSVYENLESLYSIITALASKFHTINSVTSCYCHFITKSSSMQLVTCAKSQQQFY